MGFTYEKDFEKIRMRFALNVFNMTDKTHPIVEVPFEEVDADGMRPLRAIEKRRNSLLPKLPRQFDAKLLSQGVQMTSIM